LNCSGACAFVEVKLIDGVRMLTSRHQEQNLCIDIGVLISETKKTIACIAKDRLVLDMWKRKKTSKEFASTPGQRLLQKHTRKMPRGRQAMRICFGSLESLDLFVLKTASICYNIADAFQTVSRVFICDFDSQSNFVVDWSFIITNK
jgi:hypothetical protein